MKISIEDPDNDRPRYTKCNYCGVETYGPQYLPCANDGCWVRGTSITVPRVAALPPWSAAAAVPPADEPAVLSETWVREKLEVGGWAWRRQS